MDPTWFQLNWCYFGLAAAVVLAVLLFATDLCRQRAGVSRWRDPVWLSWLMVLAYLIHNFEEYGIDATGTRYGFPKMLCNMFGYVLADCPAPSNFFVFVNIPAIWVGAVAAALLARRSHAVGLGYLGLLIVNTLTHLGPVLAGRSGYDSGLLTAVVLFIPLSAWIIHVCFGHGGLRYQTLAAILLAGVLLHVVLIGSIQLLMHGVLSGTVVNLIQVLNPLSLFVLPWAASKIWPAQSGTPVVAGERRSER
ncbi:HXXEE domain-containing protein [Mycolicibacterium septicum]|uniref:HXXEE domain-containing protein n=1 Tax=Mycolicibacterium septicum TaxID=98668 RepID=UPI00235FF1DD|nr:HXXEE domain-containing protein [Mycolicibacterium septicum]